VRQSLGPDEDEDEVTAEAAPEPDAGTFMRDRALPTLILVGALAALVRVRAVPLANFDTYFHLRFGHEFLHGWSLRDPGTVSSFATAHWVPTQWLPEVVMARTEDWFGLAGIAWLSGLLNIALCVTLYLVSRRWGSRLAVALLVVAALSTAYFSLSMRPQVLSYILLVTTIGAWLRTREDARLRWWLVPLTWIWAMVHGMWPIGIGIGVLALAGMALDRAVPTRTLLRGLAIPALSAVAAALTPVGPELYVQMLRVQDRSRFFTEWRRPEPLSWSWISLAVLLVVALALLIRRRPWRWLDVLLVGFCALCSVWSWRTVPVAAFTLVPVTAMLSSRGPARVPLSRPERRLVLGGAALALVTLAVTVPFTSAESPAQPSWMDPSLRALPAGTKVVNAWNWGGYLMWRYPQLDLLMHGYGDTFTMSELQRNTDISDVAPGWDDQLRKTRCTVAVLRPGSKLADALIEQHWKVLHRSTNITELEAPPGWISGEGSR
jgi:hypothetical protein